MQNYIGPTHFTIQRSVISKRFLNSVVVRAHKIMSSTWFLQSVVQLTQDVFVANGGVLGNQDFQTPIIAMLNSFPTVIVGESCEDMDEVFAIANPKKHQIVFNGYWLLKAQKLPSGKQKKYHLGLGVINYLHEHGQLMTPFILQIERTLRGSRKSMTVVPVKIGINGSENPGGRKWCGDMGFRLEEILFGGRIYAHFPTKDWSIDFLYVVIMDPNLVDARNLPIQPYPAQETTLLIRRGIRSVALEKFVKNLISGDPDTPLGSILLDDNDLKDYHEPITVGVKRGRDERALSVGGNGPAMYQFEPHTDKPGWKA